MRKFILGIFIGCMCSTVAVFAGAIDLTSLVNSYTKADVVATDISAQNFNTDFTSHELDENGNYTVAFTVQRLTGSADDFSIEDGEATATCSIGSYNDCRNEGSDKATCIAKCEDSIMAQKGHQKHLARKSFLSQQVEAGKTDYADELAIKDFTLGAENFD